MLSSNQSLPLITVSIPIYNCEKYIERCIGSVLRQTYSNIEILLIDDKGIDSSLHIIKKIQAEYPTKIRIIEHSKNLGLSIVRNTGIDNAKGEYIFFLDSDDEISSDCIQKLYDRASSTGATLTIGQTMAINTFSNAKYPIFKFAPSLDFIDNNNTILCNFCKGKWAVSAWNKLIKIDFIKKHKIYFVEGLFSQDELWSFHCAIKLDSITFLDEYTYYYYLHGESIIFNKTKRNFENHQTIVEYFTKAYDKQNATRKKYILNHIIKFKEITLTMQYQVMGKDINYWEINYSRLKKAPSLSLFDYFSNSFSKDIKKKNLFQNLPSSLGYKLYKWRFERT
ncbi:glycosyltransferase family 2 protein [Apibacter muscae]|uniref:glycosyltransferase family 2 protein n=1 Tax=Apibacter muscae TaxID=2509004 RepID=UPI0011ACAC01|nr:glycosyltransferase family 2 protein [Apibacter muscae]TWP25145.1 glycosyltransferase family 2 protein [Apibacter muscae]